MKNTILLKFSFAVLVASQCLANERPNIVYIMSDELAYYELSHMGNQRIHTPNIDRMAAEGIRFTQALAGAPVCAPLRCNLMTGKHAGHASVRANDGGTPLRADEPTIATMLKARGYATGGFGKWGCGGRDSTGVPEKHGFDEFFGYYDQVHAHSFYPPYLIRNSEEVKLAGNEGGREGKTYSHYEIMKRGLEFIRKNKEQPFFCYLPITPPHGMYDIPNKDPAWKLYENDEWVKDPNVSQDVKNYAAMVSMVDRNVGEVLRLLKELKLEENTIVFFTGDNGGQDRFKNKQYPRGYFGPNVNPRTGVEFRGGKGNLYEGGLRIPFIVRWPNRIKAGQVSDFLFYQPDVLPTLAELTHSDAPDDIDGISILPEILGRGKQREHEFLYWEFGQQVAVRIGSWKGIRPRRSAEWELYDLKTDISEKNSVASKYADIVERMKKYAEQSHETVRPGKYYDVERVRHERDRKAKWGKKQPPPRRRRNKRANRIKKEANLIPFDRLKLVRASSENRGNDRLAKYAIDGDPNTVWHSQFAPELVNPPHELVIDLGASYSIEGVRYLARQDNGWNGAFGKTELYVAQDPKSFGKPVASVQLRKKRMAQKIDLDQPAIGRYVMVRILNEVNDGPWASAADIGVIGEKK